MAQGSGTKDDPWVLSTPPGSSEYTMYRDEAADRGAARGVMRKGRVEGLGAGAPAEAPASALSHPRMASLAAGLAVLLLATLGVVRLGAPPAAPRTAPPC